MKYRYSFGITLIELMIVVAIVAILAAIAYPSYRQYAIRANRTEAKVALLQITQGLEKCFTRYHAYNDALCTVNTTFNTPEGHYAIAPSGGAVGAMTYVLTATPQGGQADDARCGTLRIDETGMRTETGSGDVGDCW
jgi:type IV pilus assembly protein PilE